MSAPQPAFLLVVEDSDEDFDTVLEVWRETGLPHEIRRATSGDEGLRLLAEWERLDGSAPALVLLDLNTPAGDGRAALHGLLKNSLRRSPPVVILSTSANPRDIEYCYAAGANAYHTKPVHYPAHREILRQIFEYWLRAVVPCVPPSRP